MKDMEDYERRPSHDVPNNRGNLFGGLHALRRPEPDLKALEHSHFNNTWFGKLAKNTHFEILTLSIIVLNAIVIGWGADYEARFAMPENLYDGPWFFIAIENFFCIYFFSEVCVGMLAFKHICLALSDAWFLFDSFLVSFMVIETWILPFVGGGGILGQFSVLRLLRLLRITRMARLMRSVPELMTLVKGLVAAIRSCFFVSLLLLLIIYTFGIVFTLQFHQGPRTDAEVSATSGTESTTFLFGRLMKSMETLFIMGTILDDVTLCTDAIREGEVPVLNLALFLAFIVIGSFTILNMLVSILIEVMTATQEGEKIKNDEESIRDAIQRMFEEMDKDSSGKISRDEFLTMCKDCRVRQCLQQLAICEDQFIQYGARLYQPDAVTGVVDQLDFETLFGMLKRLRPSTKVNAVDMAAFKIKTLDSRHFMKLRISKMEKQLGALTDSPLPTLSSGSLSGVSRTMTTSCPLDAVMRIGAARSGEIVVEEAVVDNLSPLPAPMLEQDIKRRLQQTASREIIAELQRRLGLPDLSKTGVPLSMVDSELQRRIKVAEAHGSFGCGVAVVDADVVGLVWSEDVVTC